MQIDDQFLKRITKRIGLLEELAEVQSENIASLIRAIAIISKRLAPSALASDPFDVVMVGPACKPLILPPGLAEELDSPTRKYAISLLSDEEKIEFERRARIMHELRQMRAARDARKLPSVSPRVGGASSPSL